MCVHPSTKTSDGWVSYNIKYIRGELSNSPGLVCQLRPPMNIFLQDTMRHGFAWRLEMSAILIKIFLKFKILKYIFEGNIAYPGSLGTSACIPPSAELSILTTKSKSSLMSKVWTNNLIFWKLYKLHTTSYKLDTTKSTLTATTLLPNYKELLRVVCYSNPGHCHFPW